MKIVLGVCGFGFGHSTRQRPILEGLLARGHHVILITNDQSYQFFTHHYPQVQLARVYVPIMHTTPHGLDFLATASDPRNNLPENNAAFWHACALIEREFTRPDLVISDYDMVSAQLAYLFNAPLITLDQQSKFLGYAIPDIGPFTPAEHRMRLGYFFPKARARFATSFFKVTDPPLPEYPVTIIPPIIGQDVKGRLNTPIPGQITVYLSSASHIQQSLSELLTVFAAFPDYTFLCFTDESAAHLPPNVTLCPASRARFLDSLCQSAAVITTAGHNLITEALYLHLPMFLLPFDHYEQQVNAHIITREKFGVASSHLTVANLRDFLNDLPAYRQRRSDLLYDHFDGDTVFLNAIETLNQ